MQLIGIDVWDGSNSLVQNYAHGTGRNVTYPLAMNGSSVGSMWGLDRSSFVIVDANGIIQYISPQSTPYPLRLEQHEKEMIAKLDELTMTSGVGQAPGSAPADFALLPNSPNPFRSTTTLRFSLGSNRNGGPVQLAVYDLLGRKIREIVAGNLAVGDYAEIWDGRDATGNLLPAGIYFAVLESGAARAVRRLVFLSQ